MQKILRNIIPLDKHKEFINYIEEQSLLNPILEGKDNRGQYLFQRLHYNQIMSSNSIKNLLFHEPLIKKIKKSIGSFYLINYISGKINSFGSSTHRDGQSFGFSYEGVKKSSKIIKVLFYFNKHSLNIPKGYGLDINLIDLNLKNIFLYKKLFMKINFYYEYYLRSRIMQTLKISAGDVVLMDNNTWHRGSLNKFRPTNKENFKVEKILLDYEIITDKNLAFEYAEHVRKNFLPSNEKNADNLNVDLFDTGCIKMLKRNGIEVINI
jgi:hypothetical protein|tara:strand:+ start:858 stop:1655 length:798 start_codon:yes stop_codon:yes gene_type:complete